MTVKSEQAVTILFSTANASTGAAADASSTPVGTLYVDGTADVATVTVTNITTGVYKAAVTLPTLTAGQVVSLRIAATVATIAGEGVVWQDVADTYIVSDIEALVDDIGTAGAGLTAVPWNAAWDAEVESEVTDALGVAALTAAGIADAVWNETSTGHTTATYAGAQLWTDIDAIKAKTDLISAAGSVTVASPVSGANVTTIQGDDYDADAGRSIDWDVSTSATVTGGAVSVVLSGVATYTGSVVDADTVRLELTDTQTAAIPVGRYKYQVILTDTSAAVVTLVEGTWTSAARVSS